MDEQARFYGKYRGQVVNDIDPLLAWRVQVVVPAVSEGTSPWALPCLPIGRGGDVPWTVPAVGTGVWVEFEAGDPSRPIWVGTWDVPPGQSTSARA